MWRTQAIVELLLGDLAGLAEAGPEALNRARRKGILVVFFDWVAILVLVASRDTGDSGSTMTTGEEMLLTLGLLAVAVHSGYRLAQVHQLGAIKRTIEDIEEREGE